MSCAMHPKPSLCLCSFCRRYPSCLTACIHAPDCPITSCPDYEERPAENEEAEK